MRVRNGKNRELGWELRWEARSKEDWNEGYECREQELGMREG